jgi:hypothetical protein
LHRWLTLLLVSTTAGQSAVARELALQALARGRLAELVAEGSGHGRDAGPLFLTGLFSLLDALLRMPMGGVLAPMHIAPAVKEALLSRSGPYAATLALVEAQEHGDWAAVDDAAAAVGSRRPRYRPRTPRRWPGRRSGSPETERARPFDIGAARPAVAGARPRNARPRWRLCPPDSTGARRPRPMSAPSPARLPAAPRARAGYTLIELMLVVTLGVVVVIVATPRVHRAAYAAAAAAARVLLRERPGALQPDHAVPDPAVWVRRPRPLRGRSGRADVPSGEAVARPPRVAPGPHESPRTRDGRLYRWTV